MDKPQLGQALTSRHQDFIQLLESIPSKDLRVAAPGKWNSIQQLEHIIKSVSPVRLAFSMPVFVLKWIFGTANRPSRSYDVLVEKYHAKLASGGKAPVRFVPSSQTADIKKFTDRLRRLTQDLVDQMDTFSEEQLDYLIIPHPLLGKLTLREMLYFTVYHVQHHQKQIKIKGATGL